MNVLSLVTKNIPPRWTNQEEAFEFSMSRPSVMLDMDMGTGKTRVAIEVAFAREDVQRILVVCPKKTVENGVWSTNLLKFAPDDGWDYWSIPNKGNTDAKADSLCEYLESYAPKQFIVVNFESVWRGKLGDVLLRRGIDMVILDESHRAKAAGSKVSKYLAVLARRVPYKMCLTGTPMANSPLDVYGQFRFLDPSIYGTNYNVFLSNYAIMGGAERRFVVGFKNQQDLNNKFRSITYSCKMEDVRDQIKLPEHLPPVVCPVNLPAKDMRMVKELNKEFITECEDGAIVVNNVVTKMIRLQQISSGFCMVQKELLGKPEKQELNTAKMDTLVDILSDISPVASVVVFCLFKHDLRAVQQAATESKRDYMEISGDVNTYSEWLESEGGVIAVQIQAGAESIDLTKSHYAVYYSLPHSLFLYNQSKSRLYRPGQTRRVSFMHLIADGTIDVGIYRSLQNKEDIIESIKKGEFDFGYMRR